MLLFSKEFKITIPLPFFDPYMHAKRGIKDFRTTPYIIACACSSLTSSTEANFTSNDTGVRYDNWIAVYHGVCVVAASPQASSTIMFIGSCSSLDILLLFRRYS